MIPAPEGFRDLREYLNQHRIDAAARRTVWIRTVLDSYLGEYDHHQTDVAMDLDHQVWAYRQIITDFKQLIEDDVPFDSAQDDNNDSGSDSADGVGNQADDNAAERRPRAA